MITKGGDGTGLLTSGLGNLKYYTVLSNLFCGVVAVIRLVSCIKNHGEPHFVMLKFMAATVTGLTFIIVAAFLQPTYPDLDMYQNANKWFHLIIPILAMIEFLLIHTERLEIRFKHTFLTMIPSAVYGLGYMINILIRGVGVWPNTNDWYGFLNWGWPTGIMIFIGIVLMTWIVAVVLWLANKLMSYIRLMVAILIDHRVM
jgi:hypothetical protein